MINITVKGKVYEDVTELTKNYRNGVYQFTDNQGWRQMFPISWVSDITDSESDTKDLPVLQGLF